MSGKHTPGPWKMFNVPATNQRMHMMVGPALLKKNILEADARLIAAAPEMLEALNAFPAEADFSNAENFRTAAIAWFEMIARPAIAKAEGQS